MERVLFAGCLTGQRIRHSIPGPRPYPKFPLLHKPQIVVTFGAVATNAVQRVWKGRTITAPHPAARQPDVKLRLRESAGELARQLPAAISSPVSFESLLEKA